jgi:hypothetical protein
MTFDQIAKHEKGGHGSPCILRSHAEAERALSQSKLVKPGMRAIRLPDGRIAIFRAASKRPNTVGCDSWHGGWEANANERLEVGTDLPVFQQ